MMEDLNISLTNHSNSSIYSYCKHREPDTDLEKIAKRTAFVLMIVLGILGNIFVIILAAKYTVRKNLHHLIINMAVSDALLLISWLLIGIPWLFDIKYRIIYPKTDTFGNILCHILSLFQGVSHRVSLMTLLVISIERFRATRRVLKISQPYTFKQRMIVCWLIPMPISAFVAYAGCNTTTQIIVTILDSIFIAELCSNIILCCVVFVLSIITIRRLSRPQAIQAHLNERQLNARKKRAQSAVTMVIVSVLLYTCCWTPLYVFAALYNLDRVIPATDIIDDSVCIDWRSLYDVIHSFLPVVNSCFSPLIYIIFLPDFRQAAKNVLCRREIQNQEPNRRQSIELRPLPLSPLVAPNRRRRHSDNEQEL